jgi:hypothetical protein
MAEEIGLAGACSLFVAGSHPPRGSLDEPRSLGSFEQLTDPTGLTTSDDRPELCPRSSACRWLRDPRIHGELLKLGITVSPQYGDICRRREKTVAWRTFIKNHANTIVQRRSFNAHTWARGLLSQVRFRSLVFTYRLSAFVVAPVTDPSRWAVWHIVHPLFVAVVRLRARLTEL